MVLFKSLPRARVWLVLAAILIPLSMLNATAQQALPHKRPAKAAKKAAPEPLAVPVPPPPPPTPQQLPAVPPHVHYNQGQLTIVAENSTLADILRAVRAQTGAEVEVPPNATERVVTHLGPGPARDVLAALLNGSHFNYVMLGSAAHPDSVDRLILTSKSGGVPEPAPPPAVTPVAQDSDEGQMDDSGPPAVDIAEQPVDNPAGDSSNEDNQGQPPDGQQQVKTPEQLLRELQQQQLLQQQLQQQQQQQGQQQAPPPNQN